MAPTLRSKQPKAQRKQQPKAQPQPKVKTQLEPVTPSPVKIAVHPAPAAAELIAVKKQTKRTPKKRSPAKANIQQTPQSSPKKPKRIEYTNAELDMFAADALPLVLAAGPGGWPACDAKGGSEYSCVVGRAVVVFKHTVLPLTPTLGFPTFSC